MNERPNPFDGMISRGEIIEFVDTMITLVNLPAFPRTVTKGYLADFLINLKGMLQ